MRVLRARQDDVVRSRRLGWRQPVLLNDISEGAALMALPLGQALVEKQTPNMSAASTGVDA